MKLLALAALVLPGATRVTETGVYVNSNKDAPPKRARDVKRVQRVQHGSFTDRNNKDRPEVGCKVSGRVWYVELVNYRINFIR